jgi:MFS family permease
VRLPASLAVLREREFALLFWARAISLFGGSLAPVAVAFAIIDLTGSATDLGLVLAAHSVPQVVFMLIGGVVADRLPRHQVMVASDVARGLAQIVLAALLFTGAAEVWMFAAVSAVNGTASAFFFPASQGIVPQIVSPERLQEANALQRLTQSMTNIAGAAIGGVLVALIGSSASIAIDGVTFLIGAVLLAVMRVPQLPIKAQRFLTDLGEGWKEFTGRTWLWTIVVAFGVLNAFWVGGMFVLGPLVANRDLGGAAAWGVVLAGLAAGFFAGGLLSLYYKPQHPLRVGMLAMLLVALPLLALALEMPLVVVVLSATVAGLGTEIFGTNWVVTMQTHIPGDVLGRVTAYDALGSFLLMPIGFAAIGPLADQIGIDEALYTCVVAIATSTVATLLVPSVWTLRRSSPT